MNSFAGKIIQVITDPKTESVRVHIEARKADIRAITGNVFATDCRVRVGPPTNNPSDSIGSERAVVAMLQFLKGQKDFHYWWETIVGEDRANLIKEAAEALEKAS